MTREEAKELLTPREFQAWELKEQGMTAKEIAEKWTVSVNYIHTLFRQIESRFRRGHKPPSSSYKRSGGRVR